VKTVTLPTYDIYTDNNTTSGVVDIHLNASGTGTDDLISMTGADEITITQSGDLITIDHDNITRTNTTSILEPDHSATFTVVDSITSNARGHLTGVNTKTVTMPAVSTLDEVTTAGNSTTNDITIGDINVDGGNVQQTAKSGTNVAGTNLVVSSGQGTGTGTISTISFQTPSVGSTGTVVQSLVDRLIISQTTTTVENNLHVKGTLAVDGTVTTINTNEVNIADNIIKINSDLIPQETNGSIIGDESSTNTDGGLEVKRYEWDGSIWAEANYFFKFVEATNDFRIGETDSLQAVATREDIPNSTAIPFWNATVNRFDTNSGFTFTNMDTILDIDNLRLDGNTISSTDGNIILDPHGTGFINLDATVKVDSIITTDSAADLVLHTNSGIASSSITITDEDITATLNGTGIFAISGDATVSETLTVTGEASLDGGIDVNDSVFKVDTSGNVDALTYNDLSLTANTAGFSISGGTTSKTLTLNDNSTIGSLTNGHVLFASANDTISSEAQLKTSRGGTGLASFTTNGALYATSTSELTTGTLPITSGGTGVTTVNARNVLIGQATDSQAPTWRTLVSADIPQALSIGSLTLSGDLQVNGGDITTASTTTEFNILKSSTALTVGRTINIGGSTLGTGGSETINIGSGSSDVFIPGNLDVAGDVVSSGTVQYTSFLVSDSTFLNSPLKIIEENGVGTEDDNIFFEINSDGNATIFGTLDVGGEITGNLTGDITGNLFGNADTATQVKTTQQTSNTNYQLLFVSSVDEVNQDLYTDNEGSIVFNPSTNTLTVANITSDLTGNVTGDISGNAETVTNGVYITDTGTVTNAMLAGSIANSKLANSTISGIALGSNLAELTIGAGLSGTSYNGSSAVTIAHSNSIIAGTIDEGGVARTLAYGEAFNIPSVTYDSEGHVTSTATIALTLPESDNTNTTYSVKASAQTGGAGLDLDAGGSGSGTDTVKFLGSGITTVSHTDANTITISSVDTNT
jgi:hypothetical protein